MDEHYKKSKLDKRQGVLGGMVKAFLMKYNLNRDQIPPPMSRAHTSSL